MGAGTERGQFGLDHGNKIQSRNLIKYFIMKKQIVYNRPLQILAYSYLQTYISSLMLIKWFYFSFKDICGAKLNNWGKCLLLFLTVSFIVEECLSLFMLLNTGLSKQFCSKVLLKITENTF